VAAAVAGVPFMSPEQGRVVYDHVRSARPVEVLELGTAHGVGAAYMAAALADNGAGRLTTVDFAGAAYDPAPEQVLARAGVADRVERRILREVPEVSRIDIHLEEADAEPAPAEELPPELRERIERRVVEVASRVVGDGRLHDLLLRRTPAGLYLSCHCFFPAETALSEAHAATDRLEHALRDAIPELHRVAVHAEPE